jgi:TolB-like protein
MAEREVGMTARTAARPVFISYASPDAATAEIVVGALERAGHTCWIAPRDVEPGALYAGEIVGAINDCRVVVLVLSARSVASTHVGKELERASSKNRRIIALRTDATPLPRAFEYFLSESQWIEVGPGGIEQAASRLAESMGRHLGTAPIVSLQPSNPPALNKLSIAVLPFANMSGDAEQEYFSDGISEDIITDLSKISSLSVISRNSSFTFKGRHVDLPQVARALKVSHVLEGSVRRSGNRVRITAQLIDGVTNNHIWAERYDRELNDIFALQDEISLSIVTALKLKLFPAEKHAIEDRGTDNVQAWEMYLRARALISLFGPKEVARAIELFRELLQLDPRFARGWHGFRRAIFASLVTQPEGREAREAELAETGARIAALAPDSWWALSVRCGEAYARRDWADAEATSSALLEAAPKSEISVIHQRAGVQATLGRAREASETNEATVRLDPLSLQISTYQQVYLDNAGRFDDAQTEYLRSRDLAGDRAMCEWLALMRLWRRKDLGLAALIAQFQVFLKHESVPMAFHKILVDQLGDPEAACTTLRAAVDDPANQDPTRLHVISWYADHFGARDVAFDAMRRMLTGPLQLSRLYPLWWPFESNLRTDPRFKDLVREVGLADYFRQSGNWPEFCKPVGEHDFECAD